MLIVIVTNIIVMAILINIIVITTIARMIVRILLLKSSLVSIIGDYTS